jgi:hypothetical protein
MNYFNISLLIGGFAGLLSAVLVYFRNREILYNRVWVWLNVLTAIWSFGYFTMITSKNYTLSFYADWILHFAAVLIPSFFLYFVFAFLNKEKQYKNLLYISFFISCIFFIFTPTKFFVVDVVPKFIFQYVCDAGPLYIYFATHFFSAIFLGIIFLFIELRRQSGIFKQQIKYILLTFIFGFSGGGSVFFLTFNVNIPPYPLILFALYPLLITYTITRFRLFNIKYFITRSILYAVLVGTVASFFAFSIFWLAPKFGGDTRNGRIISTILSSILIVVFLDPIKRLFAKFTDAIFYKDKIDYSQVLQKASSIVSKEIDLQKLLHELALLLSKELKLKKVKIFLPVNNKFVLTASSSSQNQTVVLTDHIMKYFAEKQSIVITEELFKQKDEESNKDVQASVEHVTQELENIGSEMTIPIIETGQINALFVLSQKMSGDIFGTDDINFFNLLAPQIATAIEKSKLYEEVQELNLDLQKKLMKERRA